MMLTLLPHDDFTLCAQVFSDEDLVRQAQCAIDWLKMFRTGEFGSWEGHSIKEMWDGEEESLAFFAYSLGVELEFRRRRSLKVTRTLRKKYPWLTDQPPEPPEWLGWTDLHVSHRALLVELKPGVYKDLFPGVKGGINLAWPH